MSVEAGPQLKKEKVSLGTIIVDKTGKPVYPFQGMLLGLLMEDVFHERIPGAFQTTPKKGTTRYRSLEIITKTPDKMTQATKLKKTYLEAIAQWGRDGFPKYHTMTTANFREAYLSKPDTTSA